MKCFKCLQCLNKVYIEKFWAALHCTPPWFPGRRELWCDHLVNLSSAAARDILQGFDKENVGVEEHCPVPCRFTK